MKSAPVDVRGLASALGLRCVEEFLPDDVSGKIACTLNNKCTITVNIRHSKARQRFTIAHEIAHFVLHRDLIGDGVVDNAMYRSNSLSDRIERQANSYAADILMPWPLVLAKYKQGVAPVDMARMFEVSLAVAEIRIKELRGHLPSLALIP